MHTKEFTRKLLIFIFLFAFLAILQACAGAPAEEPAEVPAPEEPAAPAEEPQPEVPAEGLPVTYGQDSRTEVFQHANMKLREMATSIAIFVHKDQVKISGNSATLDGYTLNEMSENGWLVRDASAPMCSGELFSSQPAPGFCTGFLVQEDVLITAGHCLEKASCSDMRIIFGFQMESDGSLATLSRDDVFECEEVIARELPNQNNQHIDYGIIRLNRSTGRAALDYGTGDHLRAQDRVAVIGYPSGLPLKIASDALVLSNQTGDAYFVANLDTFGSNSGSPVINVNNYQVEGILVRGMPDYILSDDGSCIRVNRCPESGGANCAGENVTKMSRVAEFIPERKTSSGFICFPTLFLALIIWQMFLAKTHLIA